MFVSLVVFNLYYFGTVLVQLYLGTCCSLHLVCLGVHLRFWLGYTFILLPRYATLRAVLP